MSLGGIVYLVGAGPGAADLITVRGLTVLETAHVVVYDRLVHPDLLRRAPGAANMIYVGKSPGNHACSQDEINELLVSEGREGKRVVRLKGGDPFVFGRGAEEAEALHEAGVRYEIIPGITSALAAPASAGIPVTRRGESRSLAVVTGHTSDPDEEPDWGSIVRLDTIVILMGLGRLGKIVRRLHEHGLPPDTPVAVIRSATTSSQEIVLGNLSNIAGRAARLTPPSVIVVGKVVTMHNRLGQPGGRSSADPFDPAWPGERARNMEATQ